VKISLSLRIFLVHLVYILVFTTSAGYIVSRIVQESFRNYGEAWEKQVETWPIEQYFRPMAEEVARSLLRETSSGFPEKNETAREKVADGLSVVLKGIPTVKSMLVLDRSLRIQYASNADALDLAFTKEEDKIFLGGTVLSRRQITDPGGKRVTQVLVPVFDQQDPSGDAGGDHLGSLLLTWVQDPELVARRPSLEVPSPKVDVQDITIPAVLFVALVGLGSLLIAAVTGRSVRGLDKALVEYRERGFQGGLQAGKLAEKGELAVTVRTISEMGGKLERLTQEGREREALLGTLSDSLEDAMIALSPDGSPVAWNVAACRLAGLESAAHTENGRAPDEREETAIRQVLDANPWWIRGRGSATLQQEDEVRLPGGKVIPAKLTRAPFEVSPGEIGALLLIRDLATLRKVEAHLLEAGRYAVLAHLAAGMAHEIRNPLHSIGLNAGVVEQYLERDWTEGGRRAVGESLSSIRDETRRLTELLNNYLGLVRPGDSTESVNLEDLCRRVVRLMSYTAKKSGVDLRIIGYESATVVDGNAERLQQAILNLVLNALQAMPDGGAITLEAGRKDGAAILKVTDTGPGVPTALEGSLFDVSVSTRPEGSGLGLPLVRLIAEAHGGSISYSAGSQGGATFTLVLPASTKAVS
jgi:PAS domain S-box-containing protein